MDRNFYDDPEQMILARVIFGEARDQQEQGKIAVGWVIRNRVERSPFWGWQNNYHDVILQPDQFSAFNIGDKNRPFVEDPLHTNLASDKATWRECYNTAGQILNNEVNDPTMGADHFYSTDITSPYWVDEKKFTVQIGKHRFYRFYRLEIQSEDNSNQFLECPRGEINCNGVCVNIDIDNNNCGGCRHKCPDGQTCENKECKGKGILDKIWGICEWITGFFKF